MTNSEQWLKLALKVARSYEDGTRSTRTDNIDRSIMAQCVKVLLAGRPLSPKQRDSFVESVRLRVGGQYLTRPFPKVAMLTARQRQTALKNGSKILTDLIASFPQAFDSDVRALGTRQSAECTIAAGMLGVRDQDVPNSYSACTADAVSLLPTCGERSAKTNEASGLAGSTERNTTERNDTERTAEMDLRSTRPRLSLPPRSRVASPADEVALVTPPEHLGSPVGSPVVSALRSEGGVAPHLSSRERTAALSAVASAEEEAERTQGAKRTSSRSSGRRPDTGGAEPTYGRSQEPPRSELRAEPPQALTQAIAPGLAAPHGFKVEVSLWEKNNALSGELKVNGETYHVNFESYSGCEDLLSRSHSRDENQMNHAWLSDHMWRTLGKPYRDSQSRSIGNADPAERFAVSGLYDNRGYSGRPVPRVMARACWSGNQLTAVELHNGTDVVPQRMKAYRGNNPKGPSYKSA